MKSEERRNTWNEFMETYKEYFVSDDENWNNMFIELKKFIDDNKKRPSKNKNEKVLGQWLSNQLINYKKNIHSMKSEERRNTWNEFKAEYNYLFNNNNNDDISVTSDTSIVDESVIKSIVVKKKSMNLSKPNPSKDKDKNKENSEEKKRRITSEISQLHQRYKTLNSRNLNTEFKDNLGLWDNYHKISEENEKSFPEEEIPRNCIIAELNKIKTKREKIVVDMGCGKGQINDYFKNDNRFRFVNYDHISSNDQIISCDISELPLDDDSVDICILSLAMWGSNCDTYIKEANRVLESNGQLYIIEPTKRWSHKDDDGNIVLGEEGTKLRKLIEDNGFQVTCSTIKKFCMFVCVKVN
jgi:ribosomal RNA-processing protein 8